MTTETDDDGRFAFRDLPPGDYFILVRKQGYLLNQARGDSTPAVVVIPNQAVNLQLRLVAVASMAGQIVDETGRPLSGIPVRAQHLTDGSAVQEIRTQAVTDEWGEYRLSGLIPGRYTVVTAYVHSTEGPLDRQLAGDFSPRRSYRETFYPGTVDPRAASPLDVVAGAHLEYMDFALDGGKWNQVRGRIRLTGRQVGPSRPPSLRLVPRVPQTAQQSYGHDLRYRVGGAYLFVVREVMPGLYDLYVTWDYQGEEYSSQTEVAVGSYDVGDVVLAVGPVADRLQD